MTARTWAIVALGPMAKEAVEAAALLSEEGISATVAVVSSLNPSPVVDLAELLGAVPLAVSAEAHYVTGGAGSLAAEVIAEHGLDCRLVRCGVRDMPRGDTGSQAHLYEAHGLSAPQLAGATLGALGLARSPAR